MKDSVTVIEVNPFDVNCQKCEHRDGVFSMTLTENSKVLCKDCIHDYRITQFIGHSRNLFGKPITLVGK